MGNRFTFFLSYYESLRELPPEDFKAVVCAMCAYAFFGEENELTGIRKAIYALIKPNIQKSLEIVERRKEAGKRGAEAKGKQTGSKQVAKSSKPEAKVSKPVANAQQMVSGVGVGVGEGVGNKEKGVSQAELVNRAQLSGPLKAKLLEWLQYKKERRENYKETGLKSLITQVEKYQKSDGAEAVISLINECMANGWRGIIWDRLGAGMNKTRRQAFSERTDYDIDEIEKALIRNT